MMTKQLVLFLVVFLVQLSAQAAWRIDQAALSLPAPPTEGSAAYRKDFEVLFKYQEKRSDSECRAAGLQTFPTPAAFFGPAAGVLTGDELSAVEDFSREVIKTVDKGCGPFKRQWMRVRPYDENSEIHPCIRKPGGQHSYPSSHAAYGVVLGDLLSKLFPEKAKLIHSAGLKVGENRVLGGVHHPSDVIAGRKLGTQIRAQLLQNREFKKEFKELLLKVNESKE